MAKGKSGSQTASAFLNGAIPYPRPRVRRFFVVSVCSSFRGGAKRPYVEIGSFVHCASVLFQPQVPFQSMGRKVHQESSKLEMRIHHRWHKSFVQRLSIFLLICRPNISLEGVIYLGIFYSFFPKTPSLGGRAMIFVKWSA